MKVAVVLLNWNGRKLLEQFLPALTRHTIDADLWVIDNASTDDSIDFIKNHYPSIGVVSLDQNYGFAAGYNKGLAHIDTDLYALVNSDIEVTAGWLAPVVSHFEKHPKTVAAQPHILDFKNKACFEYAGAAGGFIDRYGFAFCRGRVFDHIEKDEGQFDADAKIFWASGACFLYALWTSKNKKDLIRIFLHIKRRSIFAGDFKIKGIRSILLVLQKYIIWEVPALHPPHARRS